MFARKDFSAYAVTPTGGEPNYAAVDGRSAEAPTKKVTAAMSRGEIEIGRDFDAAATQKSVLDMLFENKPVTNAILVIQPKASQERDGSTTVLQAKQYESASLRSQHDLTDELSKDLSKSNAFHKRRPTGPSPTKVSPAQLRTEPHTAISKRSEKLDALREEII